MKYLYCYAGLIDNSATSNLGQCMETAEVREEKVSIDTNKPNAFFK